MAHCTPRSFDGQCHEARAFVPAQLDGLFVPRALLCRTGTKSRFSLAKRTGRGSPCDLATGAYHCRVHHEPHPPEHLAAVHADEPGHGHEHAHDHIHDVNVPIRILSIAFLVTFGFLLIEAGVGWWSGSLALLADAGHMLADAGALGLALWAQRWATRPRSERSTFGWRRAEVLAAFVNGVLLAVTALAIVIEAVERFYHPRPIIAGVMLVVAVLGLFVNLAIARLLMGSERESVNIRAALAHVLTDALGSVGAIAAGLSVMFLHWTRADAAISIVIAVLVAFSGWRVLKQTTTILLEAVPVHLDPVAIARTIIETPGVAGCADLHVWSISDTVDAVSAHVVLDCGSHGVEVAARVASRVRSAHAVDLVTIQPMAPAPNSMVPLRRSETGAVIVAAGRHISDDRMRSGN
jgi:cobalt-zinc-cadmium efflux system protein